MQPKVFGIEGIMNSYAYALRNVVLYGPTNFAPIIKKVIAEAEQMETTEGKGNNYHVLLIITDGKISDREETIRSIVKASFLPISIIIVGVGNDDFETMNELDADEVPLRDGNLVMNRDIVQFVPYRVVNAANDPKVLAKQVLYEIPEQFILYMKQNNIVPRQLTSESSFISEYTPAFGRQDSFIAPKDQSFILDPNMSFASQPSRQSTMFSTAPAAATTSTAPTGSATAVPPYQYNANYPPPQYQALSPQMAPQQNTSATSPILSPSLAPGVPSQQGSVHYPSQQGSVQYPPQYTYGYPYGYQQPPAYGYPPTGSTYGNIPPAYHAYSYPPPQQQGSSSNN